MTRRILTTVMALGALITVMGFGGIYAVFTDRATTGTTTIDSAPLPQGVDIEIARALSAVACAPGDFDDDLTSDLIQASDAKPGDDLGTHYFCIKNVGIASATLTWTLLDLSDTELECTGEEATAGDASCGVGLGELKSVIYLSARRYDCATAAGSGATLEQYAFQGPTTNTPILDPGGSLAPGDVVCLKINSSYPNYDNGTTLTEAQVAQSDEISWRFAFDATET
jgi:hypothetical protein